MQNPLPVGKWASDSVLALGGGVFPEADGFSGDFLEGRAAKLAAAKLVDEQLVHRQARQV